MTQRFEGRNLEEALNSAAQALGVERWQLTYHVLLEKRGFLGGVKRIVIEADLNQTAPEPAPEPLVARPAASPGRPARPRGGRGEREGGKRRGARGPRRDRGERVEPETFVGDVPEQGPESDLARTSREWCERLIALARLELIVRTQETDERVNVKLYGADARRVTERHGELIDAIQVLANKALSARTMEKDIEFDCEDYKDRRAEELKERALGVADRVRRGGKEELLPAMTPIERRIVHLALRDDEQVTTESRGEGFYKRVAIILRRDGGIGPGGDAAGTS